jgi:tetratricopeptide (TPR) repeat protein
MKIQYAVAASLLLSVSAFAQKDELKGLKKLTELKTVPSDAQLQEFGTLIAAFESKEGAATEEQKKDFYFYRGRYNLLFAAAKDPNNAASIIDKGIADLNKVLEAEKSGKKKYTDEIQQQILPQVKMGIQQIGQSFSEKKMYKEAAAAYALSYKVDPTDYFSLYNAAALATNAQDYDSALKYYLELDKAKFTGEATYYVATNKATNQEENFPNQTTRDIAMKSGGYVNAREVKQPSLRPEIVKNIALIYNMKGETAKAIEFFNNARKENPEDLDLTLQQADLYYKAGDIENYKKLVNEAIAKKPNDPTLFFNLGVVNTESQPAEAEKYFKKALELKPDYFDALVNLGNLQMNGDEKIVKEMNGLGTSAKDNARYDALKKQRTTMFTKALPYLEKAHKVKPDDQNVIAVLAGIYQALERTADYNAMKAKRKA